MKDSYLVTGATGFIGANLVRELVKKEQNVSIIARNKSLNWRLADISSKLNIYECDILSPRLGNVIQNIKPTYIFHLAAYGILYTEEDVSRMIDVNLKGTINLINALKKYPFKLMVNTSSAFEYGVKEQRMSELNVLEPFNDYAVTKAAATLYCQKEAIMNNLPIINLRLFTPYGYYEDDKRLFPSVISSAIDNKPIMVSSPENVRDFIFIEDVVTAYIAAVNYKIKPGEILNIGSGRQHSVRDVVNSVIQISKSRSKVKWNAIKLQKRLIESELIEADMSKTLKYLDWKPKISMQAGIENYINWLKKQKSQDPK